MTFQRHLAHVVFGVSIWVSGCVSPHSFGGLPHDAGQSGEDNVHDDASNDRELDADDHDDQDDRDLPSYSERRSVFQKKVLAPTLDVEKSFRLEGTSATHKCVRERIAQVGSINTRSSFEVALKNCGGFLTAAAVLAANGGACRPAEITTHRVALPGLSVRRSLGIRSDCVCYYGQHVEMPALLVQKLRFARPTVCREKFEEYRAIP